MIKKILIVTAIYAIIIVTATLSMETVSGNYLFVIISATLILAFFIVREVFKNISIGVKKQNVNYSNSSSDLSGLKQISTRPFFFGFENKMVSDDVFYFDNEHFYSVNKQNQTAKFSFNEIVELSRTSTIINNRAIWQVIVNKNSEELIFKFTPEQTFWNKVLKNFMTN